MKRFFLLIIAILSLIPIATQAQDKNQPKISFSDTKHNFGTIKEDGGPVSYEFQFVNDGTGNLIVYEATAQCGCTKPEYPKNPIAPGKSGVIKVTYNPIGRPGSFQKIVTVTTNAKKKKARLIISGTVIPKAK